MLKEFQKKELFWTMGYTHYWTPSKTATPEQFAQLVADTQVIIDRISIINSQ